eukprot:scaffold100821_cov60-Phaeocystis_antarctica.AAC.3
MSFFNSPSRKESSDASLGIGIGFGLGRGLELWLGRGRGLGIGIAPPAHTCWSTRPRILPTLPDWLLDLVRVRIRIRIRISLGSATRRARTSRGLTGFYPPSGAPPPQTWLGARISSCSSRFAWRARVFGLSCGRALSTGMCTRGGRGAERVCGAGRGAGGRGAERGGRGAWCEITLRSSRRSSSSLAIFLVSAAISRALPSSVATHDSEPQAVRGPAAGAATCKRRVR